VPSDPILTVNVPPEATIVAPEDVRIVPKPWGGPAAGNRHDVIDGTGTTTYSYDVANRLTSVAYPGSNTATYAYSNVGNLSTLTYPGTIGSVTYQYNVDHTMTSAQQSWGSVGAATYTYDNDGNLTKTLLPNGAWTDSRLAYHRRAKPLSRIQIS
jgi:YD repeat-containing protein